MRSSFEKSTLLLVLICLCSLTPAAFSAGNSKHDFDRWESAITRFEKQDRQQGIQEDGILFVGSSSIRMWDLKKYFPELPVINRGFGGSEIVDSTHFADRLILKHKPKTIFLYAGDNDISRKRTAQEVAEDFKKFVSVVHQALPETRIVFISIKPSLSRWKLADTMVQANQLIKKQCEQQDFLEYADVWDPMLGADGKPRPELFKADGLHLNHQGYVIWQKAVESYLPKK